MSEIQFDRSSTDATVWAKAWMDVFTDQTSNGIPEGFEYEGWMVSWFANAMCAQLDADMDQIAKFEAFKAEVEKVQRYEQSEHRDYALGNSPIVKDNDGDWVSWADLTAIFEKYNK